jgi:hypothetical protein
MKITDVLKVHEETCNSCREVMKKKNSDYTGGKTSTDVFANFRSSEVLGINPVLGVMMRIMDKIQRIRSFTNDQELQVPNESVYDAFDDILNYAILGKCMIMEQREKK